jgi:hypothetical protein
MHVQPTGKVSFRFYLCFCSGKIIQKPVLSFCSIVLWKRNPINWVKEGFVFKNPGGRAISQAVSRRPLTAEAQARAQVIPCGICGGQSGTGTGFSPSSSIPPVNVSPPWLFILMWGRTIGPLVAAVQRHSLTPSMWTTTTNILVFVFQVKQRFSNGEKGALNLVFLRQGID